TEWLSSSSFERPCSIHLAFLGMWLALLTVLNWEPFDFTLDARFIRERLQALSLVPFADYQSVNILQAVDQLLNKVIVWLPAGVLLAMASGFTIRWHSFLYLVPIFAFACALEIGQLFLRSRQASISDVILECMGAWLGWTLVRRTMTPTADANALPR